MTTPEAIAGSSGRNASDLITTLLHRAPKLAMGLAAGQMAWPLAQKLRTKARERSTYTVKVPATDEIYDNLHEWVLGLLPSADQRALVAWTARRDGMMIASESYSQLQPTRLRLRYDGAREQVIVIDGHKIRVLVTDGENPKEGFFKPPEIVFTASSLPAQQVLLEQIATVVRLGQDAKRSPMFRMLSRWGDWERHDDLAQRDLDSVVLPNGQLDRLVADVGRFLDSEADYVRRCVPWHRGHLYEGPPGTGKTSVARAIASHFGMDVWYLPLSDVKKDSSLLSAMSRITPRSMLLMEDIDVFHAATVREEQESSVTLSGLLNGLDGIATPHGLFTVLTTNTPDVIDPAVIRPGRMDLIEHFGLADADQVSRLMSRWYDEPITVRHLRNDIAPAQVVEVCKRHDDPLVALAHVCAEANDSVVDTDYIARLI